MHQFKESGLKLTRISINMNPNISHQKLLAGKKWGIIILQKCPVTNRFQSMISEAKNE